MAYGLGAQNRSDSKVPCELTAGAICADRRLTADLLSYQKVLNLFPDFGNKSLLVAKK